ncbi:four helix bundle protein [Granulicella cerasi]|uniref:Four helix bundle protein n=1 Tax=Granulicella cerasi TaxID=741063 RepID=A0ABW1ZD32_9BACT|nr:four helix bundle protein [Granulicella cerasi]
MVDFRKLSSWQKAHAIALNIYELTRGLPQDEAFGMTIQLRRAATAIPQRIALAAGHDISLMSAETKKAAALTNDLEYLILLSRDLGYFTTATHELLTAEVTEVRKMLFGLARSQASPAQTPAAAH